MSDVFGIDTDNDISDYETSMKVITEFFHTANDFSIALYTYDKLLIDNYNNGKNIASFNAAYASRVLYMIGYNLLNFFIWDADIYSDESVLSEEDEQEAINLLDKISTTYLDITNRALLDQDSHLDSNDINKMIDIIAKNIASYPDKLKDEYQDEFTKLVANSDFVKLGFMDKITEFYINSPLSE